MAPTNEYPLMVTISGVRGIAGKSLTPETIVKFISAFGAVVNGKKIVIGRDSRVSGPWVESIAQGILAAQGYEVVLVGIVPTPTVQYMVTEMKADAGLVVTSSHNPVEWNGLKFIDGDGLFFSPQRCTDLFEAAGHVTPADSALVANVPDSYKGWESFGSVSSYGEAAADHIDAILKLPYVDAEAIRARGFKVALDTVNGAGGKIMSRLLETLGCTVVPLNLEETGVFSHIPEPIPANLGDLCALVRDQKCDFGVAVDPDVDRCVLVDEAGVPLGEEYTLAIALETFCTDTKWQGVVCKNLSTSRVIDDIAAAHGCSVEATAVGEINVAKAMERTSSRIGGEGNGGVCLTDVHIGRDAPIACALALHYFSSKATSVSAIKAALPQYHIVKLKAPLGPGVNPDAIVAHYTEKFSVGAGAEEGVKVNTLDGVRIDHPKWWIHLRKSNTEPIVRVIGEHVEGAAASEELCGHFMAEISAGL